MGSRCEETARDYAGWGMSVDCKIIGARGDVYIGTGDKDVHAPIKAIELAGADANQSVALLYGSTSFCQSCQESLFEAGVSLIGVR